MQTSPIRDSSLGAITTANQNALNSVLAPPGIGQPYPGRLDSGMHAGNSDGGFLLRLHRLRARRSTVRRILSRRKSLTLLSLDYAFNLKGGGTLTPSFSFNHSDSTYTNTLQEADNNYYRTDNRDVANFSLTYDKEDWNVQFFVNNLGGRVVHRRQRWRLGPLRRPRESSASGPDGSSNELERPHVRNSEGHQQPLMALSFGHA